MARRRKRNLAGSPAKHSLEAKEALTALRSMSRQVADAAGRGSCGAAHDKMLSLMRTKGVLNANAAAAGGRSEAKKKGDVLVETARSAFKRNCEVRRR